MENPKVFFMFDVKNNKQRNICMVEFNSELPKGRPQLDPDYWTKLKNAENQNPNAIFDVNTNFALKDLSDISVFKGKK